MMFRMVGERLGMVGRRGCCYEELSIMKDKDIEQVTEMIDVATAKIFGEMMQGWNHGTPGL